jgi:hypothetical protein
MEFNSDQPATSRQMIYRWFDSHVLGLIDQIRLSHATPNGLYGGGDFWLNLDHPDRLDRH